MPTYLDCAAIVLSGGSSSRMQFPKALLDYNGETFINRLIRIFSEVCAEVIAVTGAHTGEIRAGVKPNAAKWIHNQNWPSGQLSSLQCGLRSLRPGIERCFWIPVDYPAVKKETIESLLAVFEPGNWFTIPRHQGRRGHPVLANRAAVEELKRLQAPESARDVVHRERARTRFVDVDDGGILLDIDDRESYALLTQVTT